MNRSQTIRKGCRDIWNATYLIHASFSQNDIPLCPTTAKDVPKTIITFEDALRIYRARRSSKPSFFVDAFVIFAIDDYKFDKGKNSIWNHVEWSLRVVSHFRGIITPDYSTYLDFPEPIKFFNTYRMRAYGYIAAKRGLEVINNIRWDPSNDYSYCFDGVEKGQMILVATVASQLRRKENRRQFEIGFKKMIQALEPKIVLVYGSARYDCFENAKKDGIRIIVFKSKTAQYFEGRKEL